MKITFRAEKYTRLEDAFVGYEVRCSCKFFVPESNDICYGCFDSGYIFVSKREVVDVMEEEYLRRFKVQPSAKLVEAFSPNPYTIHYHKIY